MPRIALIDSSRRRQSNAGHRTDNPGNTGNLIGDYLSESVEAIALDDGDDVKGTGDYID
ncbi:MAG: hypothetical protein HYX81_05165 [Chloroflexi bacterium]|nr:hypothetical protein [Chloroflexota bacterium]